MLLAWALVAGSIVWTVLLALAAACPSGAPALVCEIVFRVSAYVCHQQPDRSFHWGAAAWPVCARCLGLYGAAPAGALLALAMRAPAHVPARSRNFLLLCIAAMPTVLTWVAEYGFGLPVSNAARFAAALPLGAAVAWLVVYTLQDARRGQAR